MENIDARLAVFLDMSGLEVKTYQKEGIRWCLEREKGVVDLTAFDTTFDTTDDVISSTDDVISSTDDVICTDVICTDVICTDVRGGIIADEMGLGKTITMLSVMALHLVARTLIVLPVALIDQWVAQIRKVGLAGSLVVYHGASKKKIGLKELEAASIVVTSYSHASVRVSNVKMGGVDVEMEEGGLLHRVEWDRVVFDEAHHLRNRQTTCYRGAAMLRSRIQWFMTGTPVQNSIKDFYALCSLLGLPSSFYARPENLDKVMRLYVLRRTKNDVGLGLPPVITYYHPVQWTHVCEKALAEKVHSVLPFSAIEPGVRDGLEKEKEKEKEKSLGLGEDEDEDEDVDLLLVRYMRAKQMCVLPRLMYTKQPVDPTFYDALSCSSKLDAVMEVIQERSGNGNGKLVFCHFQGEIDEIERRLPSSMRVAKIDGRCTRAQKKAILESGGQGGAGGGGGYDILLLQIQTCCEGLNLQDFYSEIYFVTPHWNPSVEDQAVARCHRMGQTKQVYVFRFIMDGCHMQEKEKEKEKEKEDEDSLDTRYITLDHYVYCVQERKRLIVI